MFAYLLVRFLHVGSAILLVGGVLARQLARSRAKQATDPASLAALYEAADPIERYMVIPGSFGVLVFGVILALLTGAPMFGFLQGASRNWLLVSNILVLLTVPLVPWVFIPRGRVFGDLLQEAIGLGRMTPELRASLNDPVVGWSHAFEIAALLLVFFLMVFKPI